MNSSQEKRRQLSDKLSFAQQRFKRKWRAIVEGMHYLKIFPVDQQRFYVVTCERNAGSDVIKCLDSVYTQSYDRTLFTHLLIDDASTDGTDGLIEQWLRSHPGHNVDYRPNSKRKGGTENTLDGLRSAPLGTIVVELNGDDWLADPGVFAYLNKVYADTQVWMTYNTLRYSTGPPALWAEEIPFEVIEQNTIRERGGWTTSHPHTFRSELFSHVRDDTFLDPETGQFWESADDQAIYFAMLELAGHHARHLNRTMYVYNYHEQSHAFTDASGSEERARRIRQQLKYSPLESI